LFGGQWPTRLIQTRDTVAGRAVSALDEPKGLLSRAVVGLIVLAIYTSIAIVVVEWRAPAWTARHRTLLDALDWGIVAIFLCEIAVRLAGYRRPMAYFLTIRGLVDTLAILPAFAGLLAGGHGSWAFLRTLRLFRILRFCTKSGTRNLLGTIGNRLIPFASVALAAKALVLIGEVQSWWIRVEGLDLAIGATGFAVAILLGTKLSVAQNRLYEVEDAIGRIAGSLRDIPDGPDADAKAALRQRLTTMLTQPGANHATEVRQAAAALERGLETRGIRGPATAGLHRDIEFVLLRTMSRTPPAYETFLQNVVVMYVATVVLLIPGMAGFFATTLVVYILGGMYVVVDAMDGAFDPDEPLFHPKTAIHPPDPDPSEPAVATVAERGDRSIPTHSCAARTTEDA
jgi:hypothetical protein